MTIETLQKRIAGKEKAITALEKKIERIEAAKATNWKKNPYYYNERDLTWAVNDLDKEKAALGKYQAQLEVEQEKARSRKVAALVIFLETWKSNCIEYFTKEYIKYKEAQKEYNARNKEYCDKFNARRSLGLTIEDIKKLDAEQKEYRKSFQQRWKHVTQFNHGVLSWEETMQKDLEIEKNRKYDDIIDRTNKLIGKIVDASNLSVGAKGDLNGFIIGERGKASVKTVGAGGYNDDIILDSGRHGQCFHFRTLINRVR